MRKATTILFLFVLCSMGVQTVNAQFLSPVVNIQGTYEQSTTQFYIGEINLNSQISGFSLQNISMDVNAFGMEDFTLFPYLTSLRLPSLDTLLIVDTSSFPIQGLTPNQIQQLINSNDPSVTKLRFVTMHTTPGLFLFGSTQKTVSLQRRYPFGVAGVSQFPLFSESPTPFFFMVSEHSSTVHFQGDYSFLMQPQGGSSVVITNSDEEIVWQGDSAQYIFIIADPYIDIQQETTVQLFPLASGSDSYSFTVTPADTAVVNVSSLIQQVSTTMQDTGENSLENITQNLGAFSEIISLASYVINGGMVIVEPTNQMIIDGTTQRISSVGLIRGDRFQVTKTAQNEATTVSGDGKLVFIDDHFFTLQAPNSDNGITFPILFIILWAAAIGILVLMKVYIKPVDNPELTFKFHWVALAFQIIIIIFVFLLIDLEIQFQFGVSAFSLLFLGGDMLLVGAFFGLQLLMWTLGYLLLTLPISIMMQQGFLYFLGIGKKSSGFPKGISLLFIWVFTAFFVKLFVNVVLLSLNPSSFIPL